MMNETTGSQVSDFAKKQMLKMGWVEGKGLGKNQDGIATHIKVTKRVDNEGISSKEEVEKVVEINGHTTSDDQWWHSAYHHSSKKFKVKSESSDDEDDDDDKDKKKKKNKKDKKDKKDKKSKKSSKKDKGDSETSVGNVTIPSFDDLFKATGGARLGMRARMKQVGKFSRTEGQPTATVTTEKEDESNQPRKKRRRNEE